MKTMPYFEKWTAKYKKAKSKEIIKEDELEAVTNKGMYSKWLKLEPDPRAVLVEVEKPSGCHQDWWEVMPSMQSICWPILGWGVGTRERGFRLMPEL